ncbi:hypothetical protein [Psychromicrobium sp. YIM B11713]|uniref:hypothetical protein n=1 Tax=Psychromicrobium sp. YIM B11713 TaxID=3145233 RepID=UPI00374E80AF
MSNSNYPPQGPYPSNPGGYGQGKPSRIPPPIPTPGGSTPEYGVPQQPPAQPQYPGQYQGQPYGNPYAAQQQQYGGYSPTPPPPPKRNFPLWGWFAIGIPVLGVIALVITLITVNMNSIPVAESDPPITQSNRPRPTPTTSVDSPPTPSNLGGGVAGILGLSQPAPYLQSADWGTKAPSGWSLEETNSDGIRYSHPNGCMLLLSKEPLDPSVLGATLKTSDMLATISRSIKSVQTFKTDYPDTKEEHITSLVNISMNKVGGQKIQFYAKALSYTNKNGVKVTLQLAQRAMPNNSTVLVAGVACRATVPLASSGWDDALSNIFITGS